MTLYYYRPAAFTQNMLFRDHIDTTDENYIGHSDDTVTIRENYTDTQGIDCVAESTFFRDFASAKEERVLAMEAYAMEVNESLAVTRAMTHALNEEPTTKNT
jgi:hypothetical protein